MSARLELLGVSKSFRGLRALGNVVDEWKKMTKSNSPPTLAVTIVHNDYLAKNADAVAKFIAATRKAVEWGSKNKTQVADILRKVANMDATDSLAYANQWDSAYFASFEPQDIATLKRIRIRRVAIHAIEITRKRVD